MAEIDAALAAAQSYPSRFDTSLAAAPARGLAVVTCMDARIDPAALLGLSPGDAHVIRNAGGLVTDDALRSLAISQRALGTREVLIMQHTGCGMLGFDDAQFRADLADETGAVPGWDVPGFDDVDDSVARGVARVRNCAWLLHREDVRGAVFDVQTGRVTLTG
jgi:carbonic anhydrase